ncbi:MAG: hypothetical protein IPP19_08085, partial [Verrucomicrobia bacterium]|nr:hypothetical protein [Verrucomicrobiota bacterium]
GITPSVTYTYDRAGRAKTVTDVSGTRIFDYYDTGTSDTDLLNKSARLKSETLPTYFGRHVLNYSYQYSVAGRVNGARSSFYLDTGTLYKVDYTYDAVLRYNRITYNNMGFIYTYLDNSNLIDTIARGSYKRDYDYEPNSNRLTTLKNQWSDIAAKTVETRVTYEPETGLRQTEQTAGTDYMTALGRTTETGVHMDYSYTDRAELDSSAKYQLTPDWTAGSMKTGTDRDYTYDPIGNRTADIVAGVSGTYTPNALNQYLSAPGFSSIGYDENGNLTSDDTRIYFYDGENRLIKITLGSTVGRTPTTTLVAASRNKPSSGTPPPPAIRSSPRSASSTTGGTLLLRPTPPARSTESTAGVLISPAPSKVRVALAASLPFSSPQPTSPSTTPRTTSSVIMSTATSLPPTSMTPLAACKPLPDPWAPPTPSAPPPNTPTTKPV